MSPHFWIEFRGPRRIAVFLAALVLITVFWCSLPPEIGSHAARGGRLGRVSLPMLMFTGWVGGWFMLLFVRGQDLHLLAPFDFQSLCRLIAFLLIGGSLLIAGFFSLWLFD